MFLLFVLGLLVSQTSYFAQSDTTKYPWPTPSFNSSKGLNATFGEFRNTGSKDHFHNAVDIGEPNGNPVYPCIDGIVHYIYNNGYDSYVNIKSTIDGMKKHITYYHVVPNPSLVINQAVKASQTVIGTIYVGAAHVHLIEYRLLDPSSNFLDKDINPIRPEGGLSPYQDSYAPVIKESSLRFYKNNSSIQVPNNLLNGKIDIRVDVREKNGATSSNSNNGTYILGYRILSEDGSEIIYEPENHGIKYRFYNLPSDDYVHKAFVKGVATLSDPIYWLTNGNGEEQINETLTIPDNYLDTDLFAGGNYQLEIFAEDTRANKTSKRFPISITKLAPELSTVTISNDSITVSWKPYSLNSLKGYRIYYSDIESDSSWHLAADESMLNNETAKIIFENSSKFSVPTTENSLKYYITAVDSSGNESKQSDVYSSIINNKNAPKLLIVDGFDRYGGNGSWKEPYHDFNTLYSISTQQALWYFNISSCSNEAVINDKVNLIDYDMVIWFLGDESVEDNTIVNTEQYKLSLYLENGGSLFISGENIGQDLDTKHIYNEFSDTLFYHQYFKANLIHEGNDLLFEVNGEEYSLFEGLNIPFGTVYPSDSPDDIEPVNGAVPILNYTYMRDDTTYRKGGIAYTGNFGESSNLGSLVYLSFPFETIADEDIRASLMTQIQLYLGFKIVGISNEEMKPTKISSFELNQNYPNPFNPTTTIKYSIPNESSNMYRNITVTVFDILGREIKTLVNKKQIAGNYSINFDASNFPSGVYYYQLSLDNFIETKKMILLK
jgi:Secretion system C-terminal sorting domain